MPGRAFMLCQLLLLGLGSQGALPPPCDRVNVHIAEITPALEPDKIKRKPANLSGLARKHFGRSRIYCYGELLHQVQMAKLYQDDKQFVDMPLSSTPDRVLAARHNHSIPTPLLRAFIQEHFQAAGQELQPWTPEDWKDSPRFLQKISDPKLRIWGEQLHQLWKKLGKKAQRGQRFARGCTASVLPAGPRGPGTRWHRVVLQDPFPPSPTGANPALFHDAPQNN